MIVVRYLSREILQTLFGIMMVLLLAFLSQQTVRYLNYVAIGKIPTKLLITLISFEIPYLSAILLPLGLYLGVILSFTRMYADYELSILHMSGFSKMSLMKVTLFISCLISSLVLILMLWVNPSLSGKRQQLMESTEVTRHLIETVIPGRFQASPDGRHVIYVEKISRDHQRAKQVFIAQENKQSETGQKNWMLVFAKMGYQVKDPKSLGQLFVTTDGYRYEGTPGQNDYTLTKYKKYVLRLPQHNLQTTHPESEMLDTKTLWDAYQNPKHAAEFQWRFSIALSALLLGLLAVPISQVKPRQNRYIILLPAILIYIVYINVLFTARHWVEQGLVPISIGMWWVHVLMLLLIMFVFFISKRL